ncbi:MAG: LPS export ABC transporter permease LptF [Deferribacterota bacterium]|nr:LPS export ABC transporter permease LptF [Deferribacterota bacterium]
MSFFLKKFKLPLLYKYVIFEIIKPFILILLLLHIIIFIHTSYDYLQKVASGVITKSVLFPLIFFENIISLEVLIPLSFYLGCIIILSRMDDNSELTAMLSSGFSSRKIFKPIIMLTISVAILSALLSNFIRPWSYKNIYLLEHYAKQTFDITRISKGHFISFDDGSKIIYADDKIKPNILKDVFLYTKSTKDEITDEIIYAKKAYLNEENNKLKDLLILEDGAIYMFNSGSGKETFSKFKNIYIDIGNTKSALEYESKASPTFELLSKNTNSNIAELEWRLTVPFMTLFLGLLSIALSRSSPRIKKRSQKIIIAILIYITYYNLYDIVEEWVKDGLIPAIPGTFWLTLLLFITYIYIRFKTSREYLY